jgi:D-threo-aldose 1-dehydrogenase
MEHFAPIRLKPIGQGIVLTEVGFGGAPLGGLFAAVSDDEAEATLQSAWRHGIRYFDTAPLYGSGLSEERLGRFLSTVPRSEVTVSTKVGRVLVEDDLPFDGDYHGNAYRPVFDFSRDGVRRSLESSLERLGLTHVDIVYIHDPDDHWQQAIDEAYPALVTMRGEGLIRGIGVGMNQTAMLARFVREADLDCVLLAGRYTLMDRSADTELLPLCQRRNVPVIAGGVFNSGLLAQVTPAGHYDYRPAPAPAVARARELQGICVSHGVPLGAAAIQFPLRHDGVAAVLVGVRTPGELDTDLEWYTRELPQPAWQAINEAARQPWDSR